MKSINLVVLGIIFLLAACGGHKSSPSRSSNPALTYDLTFQVDSLADGFAIQLDGGSEVEMKQYPADGTYSVTIVGVSAEDHYIECIEGTTNKVLVMCANAEIDGFRMCTYSGDGKFKLNFTPPVSKEDVGCVDTVVPPPPTDCTLTNTCPPPPPPPPPPGGTPVAFTDVTFTYCNYDTVYAYNLTAYCSINGNWVASTMTPTAANGSCQQTTYTSMPTNKTYACNVWDPVGLVYLYDPLVVPRPNDSFQANGQQISPYGNDVSLPIDLYGQVVWTGESYTFTIYPNTALSPPVIMAIGNEPNMKSYVMSPIGGGWQVTLPLSYGLYEMNFISGTYKLLTPSRQDGTFYIQDDTTPLPGVSIIETMSVTYANPVAGSSPLYFIDAGKNFLVRFTPTSINGQSTSVVFGIQVTLPP